MKEVARHAYPDVDPVIVEKVEKHRGKRFSEVWANEWQQDASRLFSVTQLVTV